VTWLAPAKLTWYLEITGVRANGYHEIRSEMTTLSLADELEIDADGDELRFTNAPELATDESNLVTRALRLVKRHAAVQVKKNIPLGGGLGGGSADAAAILRWAGGVSDEEALRLGGDVPFCQRGGRAVVEGVGERITPLPFERRAVTLLLPSFSVATASVYAVYDQLVASGERPGGRNHLEAAAVLVEPRLGETLRWARGRMGDVQLAGSGSTMFLEGHLESEAAAGDVQGPAGSVRVVPTWTTP
jgi:4-diphosphocytidyl-2-C-methyl-D-erythritol kinase